MAPKSEREGMASKLCGTPLEYLLEMMERKLSAELCLASELGEPAT